MSHILAVAEFTDKNKIIKSTHNMGAFLVFKLKKKVGFYENFKTLSRIKNKFIILVCIKYYNIYCKM